MTSTRRVHNSKMQDIAEFRRWYEEGREYKWMQQQYLEKYNLEVTPAMFANWRSRLGLPPRAVTRDDKLIPWLVRKDHSWLLPMRMLRLEARNRAGLDVPSREAIQLDTWKRRLKDEGLVVHYEPDTEQGFFYLPARKGIDLDLVRVPEG